ncbi:MAG: ORF6N domain-containing protein [Bacteroidales bacterium]|nr:ORF6N domain-containing protein [Bacteroidales bacterium]
MSKANNKKEITKNTAIDLVQVTAKDVESRMILLRNQLVLIDSDVAELYGVQTKEVNQAVRNNPQKFPYGYIFELNKSEKDEVVKNFDHLKKLKFSKVSPIAFTERGLYMLATILKGERAISTTLAIIDTFVQVRELARTMEALQNVEDGGALQRTLLQRTGDLLAEVVGHNLSTHTTETEIELNFAVVKIKHKVIRNNNGN